jgi:DNA-binding MarR family transcriptional regulator
MHTSDPVAHAFLVASRALVAVAARSLADEDDVTLPQYRALVVLGRPGETRASDLAAALGIHQSTSTRLCDRLVRKRLARREVDPDDRRRVTITLTAGGRRLVARVTRRRAQEIGAITARMSPTARDEAIAGLGAFAVAAGEPAVDPFGWFDE